MSSDDRSPPFSQANEAFQLTSDVTLTDFFPSNNFSRCREYYSDLGVACCPFSGFNQEKVLNGPPLTVCLHCGGYVNDLCRFSRIEGSSLSKWMCSLCNNMNYGRIDDMESAAELKSGYYHCIEREPISFSSMNNLIVLAIDLNIMKTEEDILAVFHDTFEKLSLKRKDLSETAQIFLFFFDSFSFRFVRLGEKSFEPLMVDVIPFSHYETEGEGITEEQQHRSCHWRELFQKGVFHLSLFLFLRHFSSIESGLRSFLRTFLRVYRHQRRSVGVPASSSSSSSSVVISFQLLFSLLSDLSGIFSPAPRMTLFLLSNRSLPVLSPSSFSSSSLSLAKDYSRFLFCSVFYFFLGNDSISTGELLPFLSVTGGGGVSERGGGSGGGGQLFLCESITHNHFQLNFLGFLLGCSIKSDSISTSFLSGGREDRKVKKEKKTKTRKEFRETVLEIRCNHNIAVKSVAGPLLSYSAITRAREEESRGRGRAAWNKNNSSSHSSSLLNPLRGFSYNESTNNNNNHHSGEEQPEDKEEEEKDSLLSLFHDEKDHNRAFQEYQNYLQQEKQQQLGGGTIGIGTGMTRTFFREKRREYYREHGENQFFQILFPSSPILSQEQEQENNNDDDHDYQEMMISVLFDLIENHRREAEERGKEEREGEGEGDRKKKTSRDSSSNNTSNSGGSVSGGYFSGLKKLVPFLFSSTELKATTKTNHEKTNMNNNSNNGNDNNPSSNSTPMTAINDNNTTGMTMKEEKQRFNGNPSSSSSESILSFGVVQLVVKSHYLLVQSTRSERVKETQVFSFRVNEIASNENNRNNSSNSDYPSNRNNYKSGLERFRSTFQPSLWSTLQIRGLVASYHQKLIDSGYYHLNHNNNNRNNNSNEQNQRQQRLDEQGQSLSILFSFIRSTFLFYVSFVLFDSGNDSLAIIRREFLEVVEESLRRLSIHWTDQ
jgi:hypothetical protein